VAAAEQHAFNEWGRRYAGQLRLTAEMAALQDLGRLINFALPAISSILLYAFSADAFAFGSGEPGRASTGTFLAFHAAFGIFVSGISAAGHTLVDVVDSCAKSRLIQPLLEAEPEVDVTKLDPGRLDGRLELRDVSFRYQAGGRHVLWRANIEASPGEYIAIAGASGSGKSTILRLLLGFETPESGIIAVDDRDLRTLDLGAVRRQLGVVLQNDRLNTGSIFENITFGCRATLDVAWQVARDVGLADEIEQMPMGMHSLVNEGGTNLSGGQRQRLLLARALIRNPRILLLDEATSALDNRTQAIVSRSIAARGITRITVAHRLSTIEQADRIYVLQDGRVVQAGTFQQLSGTPGVFQDLLRRQRPDQAG
jgi:ABC-type bacteriocin/lantibiotic exporter with double-glycine peptidase domain